MKFEVFKESVLINPKASLREVEVLTGIEYADWIREKGCNFEEKQEFIVPSKPEPYHVNKILYKH